MQTVDIAIVGAGIVGLAIARELKQQNSNLTIIIFEKESELGRHASGRNSGVLHSGIYYPPESLKAKLSVEGARLLGEYCEREGLTLIRSGKVILPTKPSEDTQLEFLQDRAQANGVVVEMIEQSKLSALEPEAISCTGRALHIPTTAVFNPKEILTHLARQLQRAKVDILYNASVNAIQPEKRTLLAGKISYSYGYLINTAGLYADRIARQFGLSSQYGMLPFKGLYCELSPQSSLRINGLIYPVPDLNMPFLGVHFTRAVSGTVYLGPSALPAMGRENYRGLEGIEAGELPDILCTLADFYLHNRQHFRQFAHLELIRLIKPAFVAACRAMVPRITEADVQSSHKVGIRAQLVNLKSRSLVTDFLMESDASSLHILNAVSPAFTSAFSFARHVVNSCLETRASQVVSLN